MEAVHNHSFITLRKYVKALGCVHVIASMKLYLEKRVFFGCISATIIVLLDACLYFSDQKFIKTKPEASKYAFFYLGQFVCALSGIGFHVE